MQEQVLRLRYSQSARAASLRMTLLWGGGRECIGHASSRRTVEGSILRAVRMEGVEPAMATMRAVATITGSRTGLKMVVAERVVCAEGSVKMRAPSHAARAEPMR